MTSNTVRKPRVSFTAEQKLDYAKLMVEDNYLTQQIIDISGAGATAVNRWKKQYLSELKGETQGVQLQSFDDRNGQANR